MFLKRQIHALILQNCNVNINFWLESFPNSVKIASARRVSLVVVVVSLIFVCTSKYFCSGSAVQIFPHRVYQSVLCQSSMKALLHLLTGVVVFCWAFLLFWWDSVEEQNFIGSSKRCLCRNSHTAYASYMHVCFIVRCASDLNSAFNRVIAACNIIHTYWQRQVIARVL